MVNPKSGNPVPNPAGTANSSGFPKSVFTLPQFFCQTT